MKTTGERIRSIRKKLGWSQIELARRTGLTNVAICKIETGSLKRGPNLETLRKLAKALRIKLTELL